MTFYLEHEYFNTDNRISLKIETKFCLEPPKKGNSLVLITLKLFFYSVSFSTYLFLSVGSVPYL